MLKPSGFVHDFRRNSRHPSSSGTSFPLILNVFTCQTDSNGRHVRQMRGRIKSSMRILADIRTPCAIRSVPCQGSRSLRKHQFARRRIERRVNRHLACASSSDQEKFETNLVDASGQFQESVAGEGSKIYVHCTRSTQ